MVKINGLFHDEDHVITEEKGVFSVVEHQRDLTTTPEGAMREYFMSQMDIKRKQLLATLDGKTCITGTVGRKTNVCASTDGRDYAEACDGKF